VLGSFASDLLTTHNAFTISGHFANAESSTQSHDHGIGKMREMMHGLISAEDLPPEAVTLLRAKDAHG
jgi:hypothetical protein